MRLKNLRAKRKTGHPTGTHQPQQERQKTMMGKINPKKNRHEEEEEDEVTVATDLQLDSWYNISSADKQRNHRSVFKWSLRNARQQQEKNEPIISSNIVPLHKDHNVRASHELMQGCNREDSALSTTTKDSIIRESRNKKERVSTSIFTNQLGKLSVVQSISKKKSLSNDLIMKDLIGDTILSSIDTERRKKDHYKEQNLQEEKQQPPAVAELGIDELNNNQSPSPALHIQPNDKNEQPSTLTKGDTAGLMHDTLGLIDNHTSHEGSILSLGQILALVTGKTDTDTLAPRLLDYSQRNSETDDATNDEELPSAQNLVPTKNVLFDHHFGNKCLQFRGGGELNSSDDDKWFERFEKELLSFPNPISRQLAYLCFEKFWSSYKQVMKQGSVGAVLNFHNLYHELVATNLSSSRRGDIISASSNPAMHRKGRIMKIPRGLMDIGDDDARVDLYRDTIIISYDDADDHDSKVKTTCHQFVCHCLL